MFHCTEYTFQFHFNMQLDESFSHSLESCLYMAPVCKQISFCVCVRPLWNRVVMWGPNACVDVYVCVKRLQGLSLYLGCEGKEV